MWAQDSQVALVLCVYKKEEQQWLCFILGWSDQVQEAEEGREWGVVLLVY